MIRVLAERLAVAAALASGWALRLHTLADANAWWDEALAIWAVRKGFVGVAEWTAGDVHPPLYFWQLAAWVRLVGEAEFPSRVLTALTGTLLVAVTYALARRMAGGRAGVIGAWVAALAPLLVWWSMELRMYALAALFVAAAAWAALRWPRDGDRILAAYCIGAWAALHTVYLTGAAIGLIVVAVAVSLRRDRRLLIRWLGAQAVVALASLPWLFYAVPRMSSWSSVTEPATLRYSSGLWLTLLATGRSTAIGASLLPVALFWGAVALAAIVALRSRRPWNTTGTVLGCLFLAVPTIVVWLATQPRSFFYSPGIAARYFVPFAAPALALAAAATAAAWSRSRAAGALSAAVLVAVALASLPSYYSGRRWHDELAAIAGAIWSEYEPGDAVVLVSGNRYPLFRYTYDRRPPPGGGPGPAHTGARPPAPSSLTSPSGPPAPSSLASPPGRPPVYEFPEAGGGTLSDYEWQSQLEELLDSHPRIWLVELESHLQDPQSDVEKWLAARRPLTLSEGYGPDALHLFAADGELPELTGTAAETPSSWLGPVARVAYAGDQVNLAVRAEEAPSEARLVDADGLTVESARWTSPAKTVRRGPQASVPSPSAARQRRFRAAFDISERTPPGTYVVTPFSNTLTVRGTLPRAPTQAAPAHFGAPSDGLPELEAVGHGPAAPGTPLAVDLIWRKAPGLSRRDTDSPRPAPARTFVHLLGPPRADGSTVWAEDELDAPTLISEGGLLARHVLDLPDDLPPGNYELEIGVYDPVTLERFAVSPAVSPAAAPAPSAAASPAQSSPAYRLDPAANRVVGGRITIR